MYQTYFISLVGYDTLVDLINLGKVNFDIILCMDLIAIHNAILYCDLKIMTFKKFNPTSYLKLPKIS